MPYIPEELRDELEVRLPRTAGELNFVITTFVVDYLDAAPRSYERLNAVMGVLECAKQELYRRVATPYEDKKKEENGDVY